MSKSVKNKFWRYRFVVLFGALGVLSLLPIVAQEVGIDLTALPLGDGKITTEAPQVGWVYGCSTFGGGGGAFNDGEWIDSAAGTYDLTTKAVVDGDITWPSEFEITLDGETRRAVGNGLPNKPTGIYPISADDDAYNYDRNPNSISAQDLLWELPAMPELADKPNCVTGGAIAVILTGNVLFNGLDAQNKDAIAHEIQDACQGHPEMSGAYHYHGLSACLETEVPDGHSELYGYAADGFGLYGRYGEGGVLLTNADLDECHGHTHEIEWDGKLVEMYHYHATWEYPYTIGCFRGTPIRFAMQAPGGQGGQGGQGQQPPGGQGGQGQQPPPPGGQGGQSQQPPPKP